MLLDAQGRTARVPTLASATPSQRGLLTPGLLLSKFWHLKSKFSHLGNALHLLTVTHALMRSQDFTVPTEARAEAEGRCADSESHLIEKCLLVQEAKANTPVL